MPTENLKLCCMTLRRRPSLAALTRRSAVAFAGALVVLAVALGASLLWRVEDDPASGDLLVLRRSGEALQPGDDVLIAEPPGRGVVVGLPGEQMRVFDRLIAASTGTMRTGRFVEPAALTSTPLLATTAADSRSERILWVTGAGNSRIREFPFDSAASVDSRVIPAGSIGVLAAGALPGSRVANVTATADGPVIWSIPAWAIPLAVGLVAGLAVALGGLGVFWLRPQRQAPVMRPGSNPTAGSRPAPDDAVIGGV
jgi:hypothetical protein